MGIPLNIDWQQILLHLFNFVILFGILYFLLYSPVKKFMDGRNEHFKDLEDDAQNNLKRSEEAKKEYEEKLKSVDSEIDSMKENALKEANELNKKKIEATNKEAEKILSDARSKIETEREKMMKDAKKELSQMVTVAAEKIATGKSTSDVYDKFLDSVEGK